MKHTPTPWEIRPGGEVGTDKEMTAAIFPVTGEENKANAAFIVKAVNNHEKLIEALKCMLIGAAAVAVHHNGERKVLQSAVDFAQKAIKQAEAE